MCAPQVTSEGLLSELAGEASFQTASSPQLDGPQVSLPPIRTRRSQG